MPLDKAKSFEQMEDGELRAITWKVLAENLAGTLSFEELAVALGAGELLPDQQKRVIAACEPLFAVGACEFTSSGEVAVTAAAMELLASQSDVSAEIIIQSLQGVDQTVERKVDKKVRDLADVLSQAKDGITILALKKELGVDYAEDAITRIVARLMSEHQCKVENDTCYAAQYAPSTKAEQAQQEREAKVQKALHGWLDAIPPEGISARGLRASLRSVVRPPLGDDEYQALFLGLVDSRQLIEKENKYYRRGLEPVTAKERQMEVARNLEKISQALDQLNDSLTGSMKLVAREREVLLSSMTAVTEAARQLRSLGVALPDETKKALHTLEIFIRNDADRQIDNLYGAASDPAEKAAMAARRAALQQNLNLIRENLPAINYAVLIADHAPAPRAAGLPHKPAVPPPPAPNQAGLPKPLDQQLNSKKEQIWQCGRQMQELREEMIGILSSVPPGAKPTGPQRGALYTRLNTFLESVDDLTALGLSLPQDQTQLRAILQRISSDERIKNEDLFRKALLAIDDAFLEQFKALPDQDVVKQGVTKQDAAKIEPLKSRTPISSETFPDDEFHRFGNFEKEGYVGVFYNNSSEQDAFAVDEHGTVVADGMGSYPFSGILASILSKKLNDLTEKVISLDEFKQALGEGSLRATLEEIRDSDDYKKAKEEMKAAYNAVYGKNDYSDWDKVHEGNKHEAATTFSILKESSDGKQVYYAALGDSPVIVIDRDAQGAVLGWQLLNEDGLATINGKLTQVPITDKTVYDEGILEELSDHHTSGVVLDPDGKVVVRDLATDLRMGAIDKKENRLIIAATDALTKLLVKSPAAFMARAAQAKAEFESTDAEFVEWLREGTKDRKHEFRQFWDKDGNFLTDVAIRRRNARAEDEKRYTEQAERIKKDFPQLWNADGTLNILGALQADQKTLEWANDDFTYVVTAAGPQTASLNELFDSPIFDEGDDLDLLEDDTADLPDPVLVGKRTEIMAAGNELNDAFGRITKIFERAAPGKPLRPDAWNRARQGIGIFLRSAAAMVALGVGLSTDAQAAVDYLKQLEQLDDAAKLGDPLKVRDAMDKVEATLRAQVFSIPATIPAATAAKPAPIDPKLAASTQKVAAQIAAGGTAAPTGAAGIAKVFAAPKTAAAKPKRPEALEVKFKNGDFDVKMAEAFSNDVFDSFFRKFDGARHPNEEFDASNPAHYERYDKALEVYVLWREAVEVFTKQAAQIIEQDLGMKPAEEDLFLFEADLEALVIQDSQKVRGLIDQIKLYNGFEEDEARKENEIVKLGGVAKLETQLDELEALKIEKRLEVERLTNQLNALSKQRNAAARAYEIKKRSPLAAIDDRLRGLKSGSSWKEKFQGLLHGKQKIELQNYLDTDYGGVTIDDAFKLYPETHKAEEAGKIMVENAILAYEQIEKRFLEVREKVHHVDQAVQQKQLISNQFDQLRRSIFADTESFKAIARLTAGRSRDMIKGMMDPATTPEDKLPEGVEKAQKQLDSLRRAADFKFGRDRYAAIPEIVGSLTDEGEIIREADEAMTETVRAQFQKSVEKYTVVDSKNTALIRKTLLAFGQRGYDIGEQVLTQAITKAKAAKEDRKANIFQALLFELRVAKP